MKTLILIALLLAVGGCSDGTEYWTEAFNDGTTSVVTRPKGFMTWPRRVGDFDTYTEARAECDRLNEEAGE